MNDFFKGLPGYYRGDDEIKEDDIKKGIYYRWWRLMRLSQVFWFASKSKFQITEQAVDRVYKLAGNLRNGNFISWWGTTGTKVFSEPRVPRNVRVLDLLDPLGYELYEHSVVVEIPLSVTKQKILKELNKIIDDHHNPRPDRGIRPPLFNVMNFSQAQFKLRTKKFNIAAIDNEYYAKVYRILYPKVNVWLIGDRLGLLSTAQDMRINDPYINPLTHRHTRLQALVGRFLYKAKYSRYHLERGVYPNYTKVDVDLAKPFGLDHDEYFKSLTCETNLKPNYSEWQKWVEINHGPALRAHIAKINKIPEGEGEFLEKFMTSRVRNRWNLS